MGPQGGTLRWEPKLRARRTSSINENKLVKRHLCKSYKPQLKYKESKMIKSCRKKDLLLATIYINPLQHVPTFFFGLQRRCSVKTGVLKNFANFTGKRLCWNRLLLKLQAQQALQLYYKRLQHRYFPVEFAKLLRTSILQNICKRLLLVLASIQFGHAWR